MTAHALRRDQLHAVAGVQHAASAAPASLAAHGQTSLLTSRAAHTAYQPASQLCCTRGVPANCACPTHMAHAGQHGQRKDDRQSEEEHGSSACRWATARGRTGTHLEERRHGDKRQGMRRRAGRGAPSYHNHQIAPAHGIPSTRLTAALPQPAGGIRPLRTDGIAKRFSHLQDGRKDIPVWGNREARERGWTCVSSAAQH